MENTETVPTIATARRKLSTECLGLGNLPERLDDGMLAQLREIAYSPCPPPEPCDDRHLGQCLRMMLAVLPRRNADDLSGELFVAAYQRLLLGKAKDQITFVMDRSLKTCKWFPTIAECLEIASEWCRNDRDYNDWSERKRIANQLIQSEEYERCSDYRGPVIPSITQADVDAMDETMIKLGVGSGALFIDEEGVPRPMKW